MKMDPLRHQTVTRYIAPLREGGSLPLLVEADDGFRYAAKLRGSGHGPKVLAAEIIGGEVARAAGLLVPELLFLDLDEDFGRTEPDEEVQDLMQASRGLNLGIHFLEGALSIDPYINTIDAETASRIVWTDAFLTNIDRTLRNTNMLLWHGRETWLIDHGASLYFHHSWSDPEKAALTPFPYIKDHALLHLASRLEDTDSLMRQRLTPDLLAAIVELVPDAWTERPDLGMSAAEIKQGYITFLQTRLANSRIFTQSARDARKAII